MRKFFFLQQKQLQIWPVCASHMFYPLPKSFLGCVILKTCKLEHQRESMHKQKASMEAL